MTLAITFLAWSWLQSLVVAGIALVLTMLMLRRSPAAAARTASVGVVATLGLVLLVPLPQPRLGLQWFSFAETPIVSGGNKRDSAASAEIGPRASDRGTDGHEPFFQLNLAVMRGVVASAERSQAVVANHPQIGATLVCVIGLATVVALGRIACGLWAIAGLRRRSRRITDEGLKPVVEELQNMLHIRQRIEVCESLEVASAAVVGLWRPAVVLPPSWGQWSRDDLRAVLAHELAHICRGDFAIRLVTAFTLALQCMQPLAYWLRRQLILAQELAADELAAEAVGSRSAYLRSLSRLALAQKCDLDGPMAALVPVFSGSLIRRISMLRAKDGRADRAWRPVLQWSASAIVIAAAIAVTALRGVAQPPEREADGSVRVATATKANQIASAKDAHAAAAKLFQRSTFDVSAVAGKNGGFVVRLGEILKRAGFAEQSGELDKSFAAFWKDAFPESEGPAWSLREIDYIAGDFFFGVRPAKEPTDTYSNQCLFGAPVIVIRWNKPLHGQWDWLLHVPGAVEKTHNGKAYVELPILPAIGPTSLCVCKLDDHTLFAAQNESLFVSKLDKLPGPHESKTWEKAWKDIEGGLVTLVASDANITLPLAEPVDEEAKLYHSLFSHTRLHAVGVDWQEGADGVTVVKAQFSFDKGEDADGWKEAIRVWSAKASEMAKIEKAKPTNEITENERLAEEQISVLLQALQEAKMETRRVDEGWVVEVQLAGPLDYRLLWQP